MNKCKLQGYYSPSDGVRFQLTDDPKWVLDRLNKRVNSKGDYRFLYPSKSNKTCKVTYTGLTYDQLQIFKSIVKEYGLGSFTFGNVKGSLGLYYVKGHCLSYQDDSYMVSCISNMRRKDAEVLLQAIVSISKIICKESTDITYAPPLLYMYNEVPNHQVKATMIVG